MYRTILKSKIHRAHITDAQLYYEGSISIDTKLLKVADILPYEKVEIFNINNGSRIETYVIEGGEGEICLNGAAAKHGKIGDEIIIVAYFQVDDKDAGNITPKKIYVDERNKIKP